MLKMDSNQTLKKLKEQAELSAQKKLLSMFNKNDQLEQIQQIMTRFDKRKTLVEEQLKSSIQSHFISVNSCMDQLSTINTNLNHVRDTVYSIEEEYKTISHLETTLHELRLEAYRHKQLKAAKENMKNILDVDELAKQAYTSLEKNELLTSHKYLLELERCRDDILGELEYQSERNPNDINLVEEFFKDVKEIQKQLHSQILITIGRMLTIVRKDATQLVTSLRIIEREEMLDENWKKRKQETQFMPSDRPKKLREKCFAEIRKLIDNRIQGCRFSEPEENKSWLAHHLVHIKDIITKDLEIVKKLCEPCFPSHYKIFEFFINSIQSVLSSHCYELSKIGEIKDQEHYLFITFQHIYKGPTFMGSPLLKIDTAKIKDLFDDEKYSFFLGKHVVYFSQKIPEFLQNALETNCKLWYESKEPRQDYNGFYESHLPVDLNQIINEQFQLLADANDTRFAHAQFKLIFGALSTFIDKLRDKIFEYRTSHWKDPKFLVNYYDLRLIAIANDCISMRDKTLAYRGEYDKLIDKDEIGGPNDDYQQIANRFTTLAHQCLEFFIESMYTCLEEKCFKILLSREWLMDDQLINTITGTSSDYLNDFIHLYRELQDTIIFKWHNRLKVEYMKGLFQNYSTSALSNVSFFTKFKCADQDERIKFTNKISKEIIHMEQWFKNVAADEKCPIDFSILSIINRVVKTDDIDFLGVEIGALIKKCPEINSDMLYALLSLRGDISKSDYKEKFEEYCQNAQNSTNLASKTDETIVMLKKFLKIN